MKLILILLFAVIVFAPAFSQDSLKKEKSDTVGVYDFSPWHINELAKLEQEKQKLSVQIETIQLKIIQSFLSSKGINVDDQSNSFSVKDTKVTVFRSLTSGEGPEPSAQKSGKKKNP